MSRTRFRVNPHSIVCLNVKEFLARSRRHIWILSDSNEIRTHNHLVRKRTLDHLAKLAKFVGSNLVAVTLTFNDLTDLTYLITFFTIILLSTVSQISMYGLLYILTYSLQYAIKFCTELCLIIEQKRQGPEATLHEHLTNWR